MLDMIYCRVRVVLAYVGQQTECEDVCW